MPAIASCRVKNNGLTAARTKDLALRGLCGVCRLACSNLDTLDKDVSTLDKSEATIWRGVM